MTYCPRNLYIVLRHVVLALGLCLLLAPLFGCDGQPPRPASAVVDQELQQLRAENQELNRLVAENRELPRLRRDNEELRRLRDETADLEKLRQENGQLRAQLQSAKASRASRR